MKKDPSRPTIADVARRAGVSIATVSRVLNASAVVDPGTAAQVRQAVAALHYTPHAAARMLASQRTQTLGLLLPEISGSFFHPLLRGIEAAAAEEGYDLLIHTTRQPSPAYQPRRTLGEHNTDGLLVFSDSLDPRELTRLEGRGFPTVLLHRSPPHGSALPCVTVENLRGAGAVVQHLIDHGRRRILFLQGPPGHDDSLQREKGYRATLQANRIAFDPALVLCGGFNRREAQRTMEGFLLAGVPFDAVFSGDDDAAVGVLLALRQAGLRVPQDVAVAGFDDQEFAAALNPPLTTVRAPTEQVGRTAVHTLVRVIRGEAFPQETILPTGLVVRESCGCHTPWAVKEVA